MYAWHYGKLFTKKLLYRQELTTSHELTETIATWTRSSEQDQSRRFSIPYVINNKNKRRKCVEGARRGELVECFGRVGISWGELKRDLEMYMINMYSLDVWNCQIINKRYSVKNKMGRNRRGQHLASRHIIKNENIQIWTCLQVYIAHINNK